MNMTTLDMRTAVTYTENGILAGNKSFFVDTEFGRVGIECDPRDYEPENTVEVCNWEDAPGTRWAMKHRNRNADFHAIIIPGKSKYSTHVRVIEAMSRCLMLRVFDEEVSDDVVDAAIKVYITDVDGKTMTTNALEKEYSINNLSVVVRNDPGVRNIVRELVTRRDNDASAILEAGRKLSQTNRNGWNPNMIWNFEEGYYRDMMYVILFVAEMTHRHMDIYASFATSSVDVRSTNIIGTDIIISRTCTLGIISR